MRDAKHYRGVRPWTWRQPLRFQFICHIGSQGTKRYERDAGIFAGYEVWFQAVLGSAAACNLCIANGKTTKSDHQFTILSDRFEPRGLFYALSEIADDVFHQNQCSLIAVVAP